MSYNRGMTSRIADTSPIVRFAPAPTGSLHIGNVRTALVNFLFTRSQDGQFILRFDDTDRARNGRRFADGIREDLAWLGLTADEEAFQSARTETHRAAFQALLESGAVYRDRGNARTQDAQQTAAWRFRIPKESGDLTWHDMIRGPQATPPRGLKDPVIRRGDGSFTYMLASVTDDSDMGITHVIRGADHITNTAIQLCMFKALGVKPPEFGHHSLLTTADGKKISKRQGSMEELSIAALQEEGYEATAVIVLLASLGTGRDVSAHDTLETLAAGFDIRALGRAPVCFDMKTLKALNRRILRSMDYKHDGKDGKLRERLEAMGIQGQDAEAFWNGVRGNISRLQEVQTWWRLCQSPQAKDASKTRRQQRTQGFTAEELMLLGAARELLPEVPWTQGGEEAFRQWTSRLLKTTGWRGNKLFPPLRRALTGREDGPELQVLFTLLGPEKVSARLDAACDIDDLCDISPQLPQAKDASKTRRQQSQDAKPAPTPTPTPNARAYARKIAATAAEIAAEAEQNPRTAEIAARAAKIAAQAEALLDAGRPKQKARAKSRRHQADNRKRKGA